MAATKRVLIVDDEAPIRETIAVALEMAGYECDEADSAQSAYARIVDNKPICRCWTDDARYSGIEFARRLRKDEVTADIPIIS